MQSASSPKLGKLYYNYLSSSAGCSLVAEYAGLNVEQEPVDINTHKTKLGLDFYNINPMGNVPFLQITDKISLKENLAVLLYLADNAPEKKLAPNPATLERYLFYNLLSFIATELHKSSGPLFNSNVSADARKSVLDNLNKRLNYLENNILHKDAKFLFGNNFTVADAYAYIIIGWSVKYFKDVNIAAKFPNIKNWWEVIDKLDFVQKYHQEHAQEAH
jgi:glutathione S-transferase